MAEINIMDLKGPALIWAMAKAEGYIDDPESWLYQAETVKGNWCDPNSEKAGSYVGPLLQKLQPAGVQLMADKEHPQWIASIANPPAFFYSKSALEVLMRCYVLYRLGSTVTVPDTLDGELLTVEGLQHRRSVAANAALEHYYFHDEVVDHDGWEYSAPGTVMKKTVYLDQGNERSASVSFFVKFEHESSAKITAAAAFAEGEQIGHMEVLAAAKLPPDNEIVMTNIGEAFMQRGVWFLKGARVGLKEPERITTWHSQEQLSTEDFEDHFRRRSMRP